MGKKKYGEYAPTLLRILVGGLLLVQGIGKFTGVDGFSGWLGTLGFPVPLVLAWIVLLSEIVCGAAVVLGWKTKYTVWPLVIIMLVATFVTLGAGFVNIMFHIITLAVLVSLFLTGPGKYALN